MSDVTGIARGLGPSLDTSAGRNTWLAWLIGLTALLVLGNLVSDGSIPLNYGWDVRVNCAAVDAYADGLDPYFVKNLKGTRFSYPYLPVTLDVFRPLCAGGVLVAHHMSLYLVLAVLCALALPGLGPTRTSPRDVALRLLCVFGAFLGFEWVWASGNFAILGGVLTAVALRLLLSPASGAWDRGFALRVGGAALLGLVTSFKLVFCPVIAALYFLPLPRARKLALVAVAAFGFALPILISRLFYADLFSSWLGVLTKQIPDQHVVELMENNPSLLLLARSLLEQVGLGDSKPVMFATYGIAALAIVLVPFVLSVLREVGSGPVREGESLLARLDRWLIEHPRVATRVTVLAMFALYVSSPRLKEYAFFELAVYAAVLIADLPSLALAAMLSVGLLAPGMVSISGHTVEGGFILLIVALATFWILLLDFRAEPMRLEPRDAR
ncbi:hypothetical protein A5906_24075 [Bradyrhizobium sacchari]|uniref:DUF2029 domain-containing protein n=1 Tax=Bradyrhizobium sacchari TaxID=1399419 RepID=A0A1V5EYX3_9BRAD|nr:hypothetical protein [Bradyrhizobium sacchari]OPY93848.1 hypothetical protein A5906_16125 [Bradyrhizobium sacchari]OPY94351.1 hypothetical protein A5906_14570 [Bradyrhizobium sacchari]OPY99919.1 hypothetical protein A5906_24075 [Bradyrhizobium sacchari]TWB53972.1 hypothetical protein FBZ94_108258 [Bradyrhizobium sacchari]TWB78420.1 hypothetical protein FBZ95_103258 [Bradyrhizobium sacchari]